MAHQNLGGQKARGQHIKSAESKNLLTVLYPAKLFFKNKSETHSQIKTECFAKTSILQEHLKEILRMKVVDSDSALNLRTQKKRGLVNAIM